MAITRFRVKEAFSATLLPTRRRETFVPGELIVLVDGSESASESRFIRVNGIRRSQGAECRYTMGSDEFLQTHGDGRSLKRGEHKFYVDQTDGIASPSRRWSLTRESQKLPCVTIRNARCVSDAARPSEN